MPVSEPPLTRPIRRLLVANRSEIAIRVFRSAHELAIRTIAIYSHEDRFALHRFKADEAYQVGRPGEPIRAYLDIDGIVGLARPRSGCHSSRLWLPFGKPGLCPACAAAGIVFVGPRPESSIGSATRSKPGDRPGSRRPGPARQRGRGEDQCRGPRPGEEARISGHRQGVDGRRRPGHARRCRRRQPRRSPGPGPPRGRRRLRHLPTFSWKSSCPPGPAHRGATGRRPARQPGPPLRTRLLLAATSSEMVEIAPAPNLDPAVRQQLLDAALTVGRAVRLDNASTVEFLLDADSGRFLFHRGQPAHPGRAHRHRGRYRARRRSDSTSYRPGPTPGRPDIGLPRQDIIGTHGFAFQCRVTTEDPANQFTPDYGRLSHYRSASGMGIRLDAGQAFGGAVITPFYDSLLVKVTASGLRFRRCRPPHGTLPPGIPRPRRQDEHPVPAQPGHAPGIPQGRHHHPLHRRNARSCSTCRNARTGPRSFCPISAK